MELNFWKMNGAGNDFIILDNRDGKIAEESLPVIAKTLCTRRMSIGADGFMVVTNSEKADYGMLFYNSDGSLGEMCGNGARCIARYGYENGLAGETQKIETTAGIVVGERIDARNYKIRLNDPSVIREMTVEACGESYPLTYVELGCPGIPHAAVEIPNLADYPEDKLFTLGRTLRYHEAFPKGANINFYEITGTDAVLEHTYERGVEDFTLACGTGTGSVVTALTLQGKVSGSGVKVTVPGGLLVIDIDRTGDKIENLFLTGPTNIVAKGIVTDENLFL